MDDFAAKNRAVAEQPVLLKHRSKTSRSTHSGRGSRPLASGSARRLRHPRRPLRLRGQARSCIFLPDGTRYFATASMTIRLRSYPLRAARGDGEEIVFDRRQACTRAGKVLCPATSRPRVTPSRNPAADARLLTRRSALQATARACVRGPLTIRTALTRPVSPDSDRRRSVAR